MKFLFSVILLFCGSFLFGQRSTYNHCSGAVFGPVEGKFSLSFLGDKKYDELLAELPLSPSLVAALLEHRGILEAILTRDADLAARLMHQHLLSGRQAVASLHSA